jgi:hypothetical protein
LSAAPAGFVPWVRPRVPWIVLVALLSSTGLLLLALYLHDFPAERDGWEPFVLGGRIPFLGDIHRVTGLGLAALAWIAPAVLALLVAAVLFAVEFIAWRYRIDPRDDAWSTLAWSLRSWRAWLPWGLGVCALAIVGESLHALDLTHSAAETGKFLLVLPVWLLLPFLAFNPANVATDAPPARLRPHWPGWRVASIYFAALLLVGALGSAARGSGTGILGLGFSVVLWIPLLALQTTVSLAWLGYLTQVYQGLRRVWAAPAFRTVILQDLRISTWLLQGLGGPAVVVAILGIFLLPAAEATLASGQGLPPFWQAVAALQARPHAGWIARIPEPFEWFLVAAYARLLVVGFRSSTRIEADLPTAAVPST